MRLRAAVALGCLLTARGQLPQVLEAAMDHVHPRARAELETFFAPGGPHASFRIRIEEGCVGGAFPVYDWKKLVPVDAKWGLESLIAARLHQSKWFAADADNALVAFRPHTGERSLLTKCRLKLERDFPGKQFWFAAATDRGRCCDGGQLRDPGLLNHHILVTSGERRRGAWLFREHNTKHAWRAPATRDTAPRLRCFDPSTDVALPPPAFVRGLYRKRDITRDLRAANATRRFLAVHAEGGVAPPEYDLRRALTERWAPDWWANARNRSWAGHPDLLIRKALGRAEHGEALFASKFCLVVEGFAPWTPRLAEAIAAGCVPAFLSPAYRPPFADVLDWPAFSVTLRRDDVGTLRDALAKLDHAALHANLLKVRDLFAFHVDAGGAGGALPLAVFEMWRRARARARGGDRYAGRDGRPGVVAALVAADGAPARGRARAARADVAYACAGDGESCAYSLRGTTWNCSTRTPMACGCVVVR